MSCCRARLTLLATCSATARRSPHRVVRIACRLRNVHSALDVSSHALLGFVQVPATSPGAACSACRGRAAGTHAGFGSRHAACSGAAAEATGPSFVLHHNVHVCVAIWSSRYGWARQAAARVACTCPDAARSLAGVGVPTGCRAPLRLHPTLCGVACDQPEAVELTGVPSGRHHPRVATDICSSDTLREVACGRFPRCVCGAGGLAFARVCTPLLVRA